MGCVDHGYESKRYARIYHKGRTVSAHRLAYAVANGLDVFTMGGVVMHSCDNPRCINPRHLSLGTYSMNTQDMHSKGRGRNQKGEANASVKFSDDTVAAIRGAHIPGRGGNARALREQYGISSQMLSLVIRGIIR